MTVWYYRLKITRLLWTQKDLSFLEKRRIRKRVEQDVEQNVNPAMPNAFLKEEKAVFRSKTSKAGELLEKELASCHRQIARLESELKVSAASIEAIEKAIVANSMSSDFRKIGEDLLNSNEVADRRMAENQKINASLIAERNSLQKRKQEITMELVKLKEFTNIEENHTLLLAESNASHADARIAFYNSLYQQKCTNPNIEITDSEVMNSGSKTYFEFHPKYKENENNVLEEENNHVERKEKDE